RTLNGTASIDLQNGKLANVDLLKEIASVGKFLQIGRSSQNFTNLVQMAGTLAIHNGVASTNNLKAVIDGGTLAADGLMNLVDQTLNMHLTAVLNKDYSQKVGGSQIGGFMNTALANNRGELVVPVIVTGTFAHPNFAPDVQKIAQMKINNLLPTSANPGQLTSGVLGSLLGKNGPSSGGQGGLQGVLGALSGKQQNNNAPATDNNNAAQPQQQSPQGAIGDLLNRLGKKKQPQPAPPVQEPPK
ncbi:MAG TPA: AsmA-like C-terminal region-containing protein, partial [Terriglobales bacterium]